MSPVGPAGGFVGVNAIPVVFHGLYPIRCSKQRTCIIDSGDAETGVGSAIKNGPVLYCNEGSILLHPGFQFDKELVTCPAVKKNLFPVENHLDRFSCFHGKNTGAHLLRRSGRLDSEATTNIGLFDPNLVKRKSQGHRDCSLNVVGRLR